MLLTIEKLDLRQKNLKLFDLRTAKNCSLDIYIILESKI